MQQVIYNEEMAYTGAPTGFNMGVAWVGPSLMLYGTAEQKQEFLPNITNLEHVWCTLYSEPAAGSDLASLQTKAIRDGDEYVLNGQKIWTSGAHRSNWGWIAARTDFEAPKHKGISMFLMPMDAPGISIRPLINMAGQHGFNEVFLEDVRIPAKNLVGQENMGWYQLAVALDFERSSIAGSARARRILDEYVRFAHENKAAVVKANPRSATASPKSPSRSTSPSTSPTAWPPSSSPARSRTMRPPSPSSTPPNSASACPTPACSCSASTARSTPRASTPGSRASPSATTR